MPSMLEALSQFGSYAIDPPKTMQMGNVFTRELPKYVQKAASDYLNYGISLDTSIAKIASENGLNDEQTQRIITETNNQVYMTKFASLKNLSDRRVDFDLATKDGVKNALNPQKIEKTASTKDSLNFFNYTPDYWPGKLGTEKSTDFQKIAMKNINQKLSELDAGIYKEAMIICDNLANTAFTLLRYEERQNGYAQKAFDELCKTASIEPKDQILYKNAMTKKASEFVSAVNSELSICDIHKKERDYSLGAYSMQKTAGASCYPTVKTDVGVTVAGMEGLVKLACDTSERLATLRELVGAKKELEQEVKETLDNE